MKKILIIDQCEDCKYNRYNSDGAYTYCEKTNEVTEEFGEIIGDCPLTTYRDMEI